MKYSSSEVQFITIYIQEAHSNDGWALPSANEDQGICFKQPKTNEERIKVVRAFLANFHVEGELLIDDISNEIDSLFEAKPERLFILRGNVVRYRGGLGPAFYQLDQLSWALSELLNPSKKE